LIFCALSERHPRRDCQDGQGNGPFHLVTPSKQAADSHPPPSRLRFY
jgi:hypothetical protein